MVQFWCILVNSETVLAFYQNSRLDSHFPYFSRSGKHHALPNSLLFPDFFVLPDWLGTLKAAINGPAVPGSIGMHWASTRKGQEPLWYVIIERQSYENPTDSAVGFLPLDLIPPQSPSFNHKHQPIKEQYSSTKGLKIQFQVEAEKKNQGWAAQLSKKKIWSLEIGCTFEPCMQHWEGIAIV